MITTVVSHLGDEKNTWLTCIFLCGLPKQTKVDNLQFLWDIVDLVK